MGSLKHELLKSIERNNMTGDEGFGDDLCSSMVSSIEVIDDDDFVAAEVTLQNSFEESEEETDAIQNEIELIIEQLDNIF